MDLEHGIEIIILLTILAVLLYYQRRSLKNYKNLIKNDSDLFNNIVEMEHQLEDVQKKLKHH